MSNTNDSEDNAGEEEPTYVQAMRQQSATETPLPLTVTFVKKEGFELKEQIGSGNFSTVYRASWTAMPGVDIACKRIKIEDVNQEWKEKCLNTELYVLRNLKHKHIVEVYKTYKTKHLVYIFMEMADRGTIRQLMFSTKLNAKRPLKEVTAKTFFAGLMSGLSFMHANNVAHRDLKLDNFLLKSNPNHSLDLTPLLSDFGFAVMDADKQLRQTICGTPEYLAPEVQVSGPGKTKYDAKKADIYSMGISLFEMVTNEKPYDFIDNNLVKLLRRKRLRDYKYNKECDPHISPECKDLIYRMLEPDPNKRITIDGISEHKGLMKT